LKGNRTNLALTFERVVTFIQEIRVGVRHGSNDRTSWKTKRPCCNEFVKPIISIVDLKVHGNICNSKFHSNLLCTT
jgi:hypothetical protein